MSIGENKSLVIAAAGTGGHVFPGISIAQKFIEMSYNVHWFGTKKGIEQKLIPDLPFSFYTIKSIGMRNKNIFTRIQSIYFLFTATILSFWKLKKIRPKFVLVMGGYIALPIGFAAIVLRIPIIIHEQNCAPGLANRILAKYAAKILTGFPDVFNQYQTAKFTGNPVRATIVEKSNSLFNNEHTDINILVLGGSLGAKQINELVPDALVQLNSKYKIIVWHQTGVDRVTEVTKTYKQLNINYARIEPFINDMAYAYKWADCVIARSGALTVCEIATAGLASILIPYPNSVDNHQMKNARWLANNEAAIVLDPKNLTSDVLSEALNAIFKCGCNTLNTMSKNALQLTHKNALKTIIEECSNI